MKSIYILVPAVVAAVVMAIASCQNKAIGTIGRGTILAAKIESLPNIATKIELVKGLKSVVSDPAGNNMVLALAETELTVDQAFLVFDENAMVGDHMPNLRVYPAKTPWTTNYQTSLWFIAVDSSFNPVGAVRVCFIEKKP